MPIRRLVLVLAVAGLALAACGVRGDLEPPPGAATAAAQPETEPARPAVEAAPVATGPDLDVFDDEEDTERVIQSQRRSRYPPASDSFVLDPLL
jgi:predicted small lipoprotein YifL